MENKGQETKAGLWNSIFPPKYDFQGMLLSQASETRDGVKAFHEWLDMDDLSQEPRELMRIEQQADDLRLRTEELLLEAFSTPFDRQDIYSFSRQMDHILNFCLSTAHEMRAFKVHPDGTIKSMTVSLHQGTEMIVEAVRIMARDPAATNKMIIGMRQSEHDIEKTYVACMAYQFTTDDVIEIMKKREVYHHLKDAGRALSITIDILHRIVVELA
ncbi:MAG: hypothetical protein A4E31_00990 [Methanomassiliicoccales archaeon PtaU1.Bin030]|nr:MAG: hypothetical protein A4E31_00990 [Methanomassiliicoccales archaeon PtaU1.Bin030]